MHIGKRLFPYPLLNSEKLYSQFKFSTFALDYQELISESESLYILKNIHCELDNTEILKLIQENRAKIVSVVECPTTMYRKYFELPLTPTDIEISLMDIAGKITVSAYVVATEEIPNYSSADFLDGYDGYTFTIEKNDIIAIDDGYTNKIEFDNEEDDNKKSSIFVVIKDKKIKDETMEIEYDVDKITISLPEEEWNKYDKTKRISKFQSLYFSILAVPALSYALSCLQRISEDVDVMRMDYRWFDSFLVAYEKEFKEELTNEEFSKMNPHVVAQKLLNKPVTKSIGDIFNLTIGVGGAEDGD